MLIAPWNSVIFIVAELVPFGYHAVDSLQKCEILYRLVYDC